MENDTPEAELKDAIEALRYAVGRAYLALYGHEKCDETKLRALLREIDRISHPPSIDFAQRMMADARRGPVAA